MSQGSRAQINQIRKTHILGEFFRSVYTTEPNGEIPKLDDQITTGFLNDVPVDITNDRVPKIIEKLKTNNPQE